jgi:hypothetical protein
MNAINTSWREPRESGIAPRRIPFGYLAIAGIISVAAVIGWFAATQGDESQPVATANVPAEQTSQEETTNDPIVDDEVPIEPTPDTTPPLAGTQESTTTVPPTTTTAPPPAKQERTAPDLSGTDFTKITNEFIGFEQWLRANPDASQVQLLFEKNSPAFGHVFHDMETASPAAQRAFEIQNVTVEALGGSKVKVVARVRYDNDVMNENITFNRQADGTWRAIDRVVN